MANNPSTFPAFRFSGSHREIGRQFGESCRKLITLHRDYALERLAKHAGASTEQAVGDALNYQPFVLEHAPFFDEEIRGLAEGANLSLAEAYLLQLRAELAVTSRQAEFIGDECTTFALLPEVTTTGRSLLGQNADLPRFYREVGVVVEFTFDDMSNVLMVTPAGQLSYIGMNDRGLAIAANFLSCDGWGYGYPRYLLSRLALTQSSVADALARVRPVPRASSRNLLLCDTTSAADLETTVTRDALLEPVDGVLVHANHYTAPDLLDEERAGEKFLPNTRTRHKRMAEMLQEHRGTLNPETMMRLFQDRTNAPNAICRTEDDDVISDSITFASMICEPSTGAMWVAVGPPNRHNYVHHTLKPAANFETAIP